MNAITSDLEYLAELACHDKFADHGDLLLSLSPLLVSNDQDLDEKQRERCISLTIDLLNDCSLDDQISLAELIAKSPHAPGEVIKTLARNHIAVAAIVLEQSPALNQEDLIDVAQTAGTDHCKAMAVRSDLSEKTCAVIISNGDEETLKTLINNHAAKIAQDDLARLVAIAKRFPILALPLLQRPNIQRRHAEEIADCSSQTVKTLVARMVPSQTSHASMSESAENNNRSPNTDLERAQHRIEALKKSGRLRAAILVKALHQNDEKLFVAAFAEFLDMTTTFLSKLLESKSASAMALAYRALGGSQQQFETIIVLYRSMKNRPTALTARDRSEIDRIFHAVSQDGAKHALTSLQEA